MKPWFLNSNFKRLEQEFNKLNEELKLIDIEFLKSKFRTNNVSGSSYWLYSVKTDSNWFSLDDGFSEHFKINAMGLRDGNIELNISRIKFIDRQCEEEDD